MKTKIYALTLLGVFLLAGCDSPGGGRGRSRIPASNYSLYQNSNFNPSTTGTDSTGTTTTTNNSNSTNNNSSEPGFENCNLNNTSQTKSVPEVTLNICQSTVDETKIKVKFGSSDNGMATCFIPLNKGSNGASIYIGSAQCTTHANIGSIMNGTLLKNRNGYTQAKINGVMILKQKRLQDFFACMDAVSNFITNNCPQNPNSCLATAQSFQQQVCNYFIQQGNFIDLAF